MNKFSDVWNNQNVIVGTPPRPTEPENYDSLDYAPIEATTSQTIVTIGELSYIEAYKQ